jgi:predicted secreted protein
LRRRKLTRRVRFGDPVTVRLPAPVTSGYRWKLIEDENAWRLVKQENFPAKTFGGENETEYSFKPLHAGRTVIRCYLARPWENKPLERLDIVVFAE